MSKGCEALSPEEVENMAFFRVSTGYSEIPSSCEMKVEHAFMHCKESRPSFGSGHLGVYSTEAGNTE